MNNDIAFQIVCARCACLSIRIEEPLKSSREAIVFCGDCGYPRGTVGALRDLAVQRHVNIVVPVPSLALSADERTGDKLVPSSKISAQYAELRHLREQVRIAEWFASESKASRRKGNAESATLQPSHNSDRSLGGKRDWKMPSLECDANQVSKV